MLCSPSQLIDKPLLVLAQKLFVALPSLAQGDLPTPELLAANPTMFGPAIKGAITRQQGNKSNSRLLLLFDQFEELFSWPKAQQSELIAVLQNFS